MQLEQRKLFLESNGYRVFAASTDQVGLAFLRYSHVDAIVLEHMDDFAIAKKMKQANSKVPIVMVASTLDLPDLALDSIDALVGDFDGAQFLLETLHFLLEVKPSQISHGAPRNTRNVRDVLAESKASTWRARVMA